MIFFRSILAGLAATVIAEILVNFVAIAILLMGFRQPPNSDTSFVFVGWDPVSFARTVPGWIILVLAFLLGFWWEHRRASAH